MRASIDIGSNSILLLIAEYSNTGLNEIGNFTTITGLGRDLDKNGFFCDEAINDSYAALEKYAKEIKKYDIKAKDVIVTATEASRVATNAAEFYKKVEKKLGFSVQIINAEGEAFYTALGVAKGSSTPTSNHITIMDIGGASTEFIKVQLDPFKIETTISLPMGSVRGTDWIRDDDFTNKTNEIVKKFDINSFKTQNLLCVAGSMTSLGGMIKGLSTFESDSINGAKINFDKFCNFVDKISHINSDSLLKQYPFLGKRARTIVAGAQVAKVMGQNLKIESMEISTYGLRYGTLIQGVIDERFLTR